MNWAKIEPDAYTAMVALERYVRGSGLDKKLVELVKLRASQINQCAYCIDMHWKDLRAEGETEQRLYGLNAWRESPYYTDRERAALEWTEAVTVLTDGFVPDELYERVLIHFTEADLVKLTMAIIVINGWNRLSVSFRGVPGQYQPAAK
jgi:AhpD family alkylhydroperoxidase